MPPPLPAPKEATLARRQKGSSPQLPQAVGSGAGSLTTLTTGKPQFSRGWLPSATTGLPGWSPCSPTLQAGRDSTHNSQGILSLHQNNLTADGRGHSQRSPSSTGAESMGLQDRPGSHRPTMPWTSKFQKASLSNGVWGGGGGGRGQSQIETRPLLPLLAVARAASWVQMASGAAPDHSAVSPAEAPKPRPCFPGSSPVSSTR